MTTSGQFSPQFTRIDPLILGQFPYLKTGDKCYYLGEYTVAGGYDASKTNDLVLNLKKEPSRRGKREWHYKQTAIATCAKVVIAALRADWFRGVTLVPVPPSKIRTDPEYDDRILQVLHAIAKSVPSDVDVRELVSQSESYDPLHSSEVKKTPESLRKIYQFNPRTTSPAPSRIALFDDVINRGTHFRALKDMLVERWPGVKVIGLFIARAVSPEGPSSNDQSAQ